MITIDKLIVSYEAKRDVLNKLSLSMGDNLIHGIVGLNGAGKTTLLNTMFGLKKAKSGQVLFHSRPLNKKEVSYLVTENFFYPNITGKEYLKLFQNDDFNEDQWNELFSLPLSEIIDGYSTGMKKKLALMGVLKQDKQVVILDEPFNGLDIETCRIMRMILLKLKEKGKTIILTSHIIETLTNMCDHIHYLEKGTIAYSKDKEHFAEFERDVFEAIESKNQGVVDRLMS